MTGIEFPRKPASFLAYFFKNKMSGWQKTAIILLFLITALISMSNVVMLYGFKLLVDALPTINPHDMWSTLSYPFLLVIGCCLFHTGFYRLRDIIDLYSTPHTINRLRVLLLNNILLHSPDFFHNRFSGELTNKINNVIQSFRTLLWDRCIHGFLATGFAIASSCVLLWSIDFYLALYLLAITIFLCLSVYFLGGPLGRASANFADRESDISGQLVDTITNISSVKNYSNMSHEVRLLHKIQIPYVSAYKRMNWWGIVFWLSFDVIISALIIGAIWYLISNWSTGKFTVGDVSIAIMVGWDVWYRMAYLAWQLTQLSADLGRISSALNEFVRPVDVEDKQSAFAFNPQSGQILFDHVGFTYNSGHPVFLDFSLEIPSSQKLGVVGLSGAGKTTLCQLLLRNYDVQTGHIIIGEQNIRDVTQDSLRKKVAVIPQDPSLFHRSLYENILYGRPDATEEEVISAAKAAQAHDFIIETPDKYQTMVGERGVKLSGGQRQRIAIARAILKDAPILILDEATSALDSDTERLIQSALNTAMQGRTTIVVAHRLSTLAHLDRIIVMRDGKIVEDGNLQSLISMGGHFSYLWNLQAGGFLPEKI